MQEQVTLLALSSRNFDEGHVLAGRQIATSLRTLLYAPQRSRKGNRTIPLFHQVGLPACRFEDSAYAVVGDRSAVIGNAKLGIPPPACGLVGVHFNETGAQYYAPLDGVETRRAIYSTWWTSPVLRDSTGKTASRLNIVQHVADTDGGAHVDVAIDADYYAWRTGMSLSWAYRIGDQPARLLENVELFALRQIAHEVLRTLRINAPWSLDGSYPDRVFARQVGGFNFVGAVAFSEDGNFTCGQTVLMSNAAA
jgi:hypothetical protein